jgi:McrBC 5-methylcytosine restriction system component
MIFLVLRVPQTSRRRGTPARFSPRHVGTAPTQARLYKATDHGHGVVIPPESFAPAQRGGGWGPFLDSFLRLNEGALEKLDVSHTTRSNDTGVQLALLPGGRAGAVPLRSAQTGHVTGGFLVEPRFGWAGVGRVLVSTGWAAAPEILDFPLVPGSGREVPPWVLAGPVLKRLEDLLKNLRRGYRAKEQVLQKPRGQIIWSRYVADSLVRGRWDSLPCRFPDLSADPLLRRVVRWALEHVRQDLSLVGGTDFVARLLIKIADDLLDEVRDVPSLVPTRSQLDLLTSGNRLSEVALRRGLEALGWLLDERGLGGGREMDGLAWTAALDSMWEHYVEAVVRHEALMQGGIVRVGRARETLVPLDWTDPSHRSLGHLMPDIVVTYRDRIDVVDAKYKSHFAELDEHGWHAFTTEVRDSHRADMHQILAYASLFEAPEVRAILVYPLREGTWRVLRERGRDTSIAEIFSGRRRVRLELRGVPFGIEA